MAETISFENMQVNRDRVVDLDFELGLADAETAPGHHELDSPESK
jgi:hypothetical protein